MRLVFIGFYEIGLPRDALGCFYLCGIELGRSLESICLPSYLKAGWLFYSNSRELGGPGV